MEGLSGPGGHTRAVVAAGVIVGTLGGGQCGQSHEFLVRSAEELGSVGRKPTEGWGPVGWKSRCVTPRCSDDIETTWPHGSTRVYRVEGTEVCGLGPAVEVQLEPEEAEPSGGRTVSHIPRGGWAHLSVRVPSGRARPSGQLGRCGSHWGGRWSPSCEEGTRAQCCGSSCCSGPRHLPHFSHHRRPSSWHLFLSARSSAATEWPACLQGLFLPAFPAAMLFLRCGLSHHFVFPSPLRLPVATTHWPVSSQVSTLVPHCAFPLQTPPPLSGAHISPHTVSCPPLSASEHPHIPPCLPTASSS